MGVFASKCPSPPEEGQMIATASAYSEDDTVAALCWMEDCRRISQISANILTSTRAALA